MRYLAYIILTLCLFSYEEPAPYYATVTWDQLKGFPSLYGEGANNITGGRGGVKFFITSTATTSTSTFVPASGGVDAHYTGTWEGALNLTQARHIIPRVNGNVNYGSSGITTISGATKGNFTYHGHLAPEGGLAINGMGWYFENMSNTVFRYLTVRHGNTATIDVSDCLNFSRCDRWGFDHVSTGWSGDETFALFPGIEDDVYDEIIVQRTISGQGRDNHNRGPIMGATDVGQTGDFGATFHNNLYTNWARTPNVAGNTAETTMRTSNSVIYNWQGRTINVKRGGTIDEINNYYIPGPDTFTPLDGGEINQFQFTSEGRPSIYTAGNIVEGYLTDPLADNRFTIWSEFDDTNTTDLPSTDFRLTPLAIDATYGYNPVSASETYQSIIVDKEVGNNRSTSTSGTPVFGHDSIDEGLLNAVLNRTDPDLPEGSWTPPSRGTASFYQDDNWNGIYDVFETQNNITASTDVKASYTWQGVLYVNNAGYDSFEAWSEIIGGVHQIDVASVLKRQDEVTFMN